MHLLALIALLVSCFVLSATACTCLQRSAEEVYCDSDVVLKVKILMGFSPVHHIEKIFFARVLDSFKYPAGRTVPRFIFIATGASSAACGVDFQRRKKYLVPGALFDQTYLGLPKMSASICSTAGFCTVPTNPQCAPKDECVFCTQAVPQCREGCENCEITPQTCDSCATAVCKDCVFCTQAVPQCEEGCENCKINPQTCDTCATAECQDDCVFCTQQIPQCDADCDECEITPQTCDSCATAECKDECVFCTQAVPQCKEGCENCEITPQTCDSCATAVCKDCVVCTQAVPQCNEDCVKCAISPQTCDSCASAQCCDFLKCFPGPSSCTEGCQLSGTTCCADVCV